MRKTHRNPRVFINYCRGEAMEGPGGMTKWCELLQITPFCDFLCIGGKLSHVKRRSTVFKEENFLEPDMRTDY
jgi:hypothetical protein